MNNKSLNSTRKLTTLAMLAAVSIVLVGMIHFSIIPAAPFLEYDPADVPILLAAFLFGPWAGLALTFVVSILQGLTVSAGGGFIGVLMHILATGSFCVVAGLIYQKQHTKHGAIIALVAGTLTMTAMMVVCNLIFTPIFMGSPVSSVIEMLLPAIIPFNLIKAGANSILAFIVYKPIRKFVFRED